MKNVQSKKSEMTLDKLAILTKKGFDEIRGEMNQGFDEIRGEMNTTTNELREEFLTGSDKIVGELQIMREENAAGFGIYKELEKRVFTLE